MAVLIILKIPKLREFVSEKLNCLQKVIYLLSGCVRIQPGFFDSKIHTYFQYTLTFRYLQCM